MVQWTVLPITLCPSYLDATTVQCDTTDVSINVAIGTKERGTAGVLHDTIRTQLTGLIDKGIVCSQYCLVSVLLSIKHM